MITHERRKSTSQNARYRKVGQTSIGHVQDLEQQVGLLNATTSTLLKSFDTTLPGLAAPPTKPENVETHATDHR